MGSDFYNKWMTPVVGLVLLFLTGVGPLLRLAQVHRVESGPTVSVAGGVRARQAAGGLAAIGGFGLVGPPGCASRCAPL